MRHPKMEESPRLVPRIRHKLLELRKKYILGPVQPPSTSPGVGWGHQPPALHLYPHPGHPSGDG